MTVRTISVIFVQSKLDPSEQPANNPNGVGLVHILIQYFNAESSTFSLSINFVSPFFQETNPACKSFDAKNTAFIKFVSDVHECPNRFRSLMPAKTPLIGYTGTLRTYGPSALYFIIIDFHLDALVNKGQHLYDGFI